MLTVLFIVAIFYKKKNTRNYSILRLYVYPSVIRWRHMLVAIVQISWRKAKKKQSTSTTRNVNRYIHFSQRIRLFIHQIMSVSRKLGFYATQRFLIREDFSAEYSHCSVRVGSKPSKQSNTRARLSQKQTYIFLLTSSFSWDSTAATGEPKIIFLGFGIWEQQQNSIEYIEIWLQSCEIHWQRRIHACFDCSHQAFLLKKYEINPKLQWSKVIFHFFLIIQLKSECFAARNFANRFDGILNKIKFTAFEWNFPQEIFVSNTLFNTIFVGRSMNTFGKINWIDGIFAKLNNRLWKFGSKLPASVPFFVFYLLANV